MKLIIAGSRDFDAKKLARLLEINDLLDYFGLPWPSEFVHGGCPTGADAYLANVADEYWRTTPIKVFNADWNAHGKAAGPIRNGQMAEYADALILIWDGTSKGSTSMKREMQRLKKPVYEIIFK